MKVKAIEEEKVLWSVWTDLAEAWANTPLESAGAEWHQQAEAVAESSRAILMAGVKKFRQRALEQAWSEYRQSVAELQSRRFQLPIDPGAQRELLASLFDQFPQMQDTFLTVQHREFKNVSDSDVESFLKQMQCLGVMDAFLKKDSEDKTE